MSSRYTVRVLDAAGAVVAPVNTWSELKLVKRFLDVGTATVTLPLNTAPLELFNPGAGLAVSRDGLSFDTYLVDNYQTVLDAKDAPYPGTLTVVCPDRFVDLRDRLTWPKPDMEIEFQPASEPITGSADTRKGPLENVVLGYVMANTGQYAPIARRRTNLHIPTWINRGPTVTRSSRFENLLDLVRSLIGANYPASPLPQLALRTIQVGDQPTLDVYTVVDRSADVLFAYDRGNLAGYDLEDACASGNAVVVDSSAGYGRVEMRNDVSVSRWGRRVETYVQTSPQADAGTSDANDERDQAGREALGQQTDAQSVQLTVADTAQTRFGRDYDVGDVVGARIRDQVLRVLVQQVEITVRGGVEQDEVVVPTIGTDVRMPVSIARIRDLTRRVAMLERR